jgi:uncharacterized protein
VSTAGDSPRIAVVTGASSGIGEATARLLAARGWLCVLVARREQRLRALVAEIGGEVEVCDLGDRGAVEATAARVLERHPVVHLLVNNAGMPARDTFVQADLDLVERVLAVNYLGGVWCTRALLPGLETARGAHVVNVVSIAGAIAFARSGPYVASKHAQLAFSRCLRPAVSRHGIAVHTILPGFVQTEGFSQAALVARRRSRWLVTDPGRVAEAIVHAVDHGKAEVVVPWFPYRPAILLHGVAPGLVRAVERLMPRRRR